MSTKPNETILPKAIDEKLEVLLGQFSDLIDEAVNFGTHAFVWCFERLEGKDEKIPIFMSFRHILSLLDSISALVRNACIEPCKILLRATFESTLSIEYILERDSDQRGMDFMVCYYNNEIKRMRRWDPDDPMYLNFQADLKKDKILQNFSFELPADEVKRQIEVKKKILQLPHYIKSEEEYNRLKQKLKKRKKPANFNWYSMHDGPKNLEELSRRLDRIAMYKILYSHWSESVHGIDIIRDKVSIDKSKRISIHQIRLPTRAQEIRNFAIEFATLNIRTMIQYFRPDRENELRSWYIANIRDHFIELLKKKLIEVK